MCKDNLTDNYFVGFGINLQRCGESSIDSVSNKICVITGATDGIGKRTAEVLAEKGFNLGIVGRNKKKGRALVKDIFEKTGNEKIHYFNANLLLMSEVKRVASEIKEKFEKIDVLLNNVGAAFFNESYTSEGFESTFALNHLSYFLLTHILLENMDTENGSRIINVASDAHFGVDLEFDDVQSIKSYGGYQNYKKSKLMNVLFSYELAERLKDKPITVNALHPGFVASKFGHNNSGLKVWLLKLSQKLKAINVNDGAETSIFLASSPEAQNISGKYFYKKKEKKSSMESLIINSRKKLWEKTETMLKEWN